MAVQTKTTVTYTCDRCGDTDINPRIIPWGGKASLTIDLSMVCYDGSTGGSTSKQLLCARCYTTLNDWLTGKKETL